MRPNIRRTILRLTPVALVAACSLAITTSGVPAAGITLYEGSYSDDLSSSTPGGLQPANGVTLPYPSSNLQLSWEPVPGAKKYQLQIARVESTSTDCNADGSFQLDNIAVTASTDQNEWVPSLATDEEGKGIWTGTYCWRVRTTGKGYGEWSSAHRLTRSWSSSITGLKFFNDHDGPVPRTSASPDWATGNSVTRNAGYVTWDHLPGAATYDVQISSSRSFAAASIITTREGVRGNQVTLLHLPDDTYYWRVRGVAPNDTEGGWSSGTNTFTVRWLDTSWSDDSRIWPADGSTVGEIKFGWTPMPGATYYQYQMGTDPGCFWNPEVPAFAPNYYGHWVNFASEYDDSDPPVLLETYDPHFTHCRLTSNDAKTINNWMTANGVAEDVVDNIRKDCLDEDADPDVVNCEPAGWPDNATDDWGAIYHGADETTLALDGRYGDAYSIYWRVRPVYTATQERETGWKIGGDGTFKSYGSWTQYGNRHHSFDLDLTADATSTVDTRCTSTANPGGGCLEHIGTSMDATETPGVVNDLTMQWPLMTWKRFPGAGGYIVEIARDPLFNNIARVSTVSSVSHSLALLDSMTDNSEDTGYWWRVTPCSWDPELEKCLPAYAPMMGGLPASYGLGGYSDQGVRQTFPKQSDMQVEVVPGFDGAAPLLRWARADASATDYAAWSRGLAGAAYYELELSRNPYFSDAIEIKTTIPRAVPFEAANEGKLTPLDDGLWYFRVRAVDDNEVFGGWSETGTFNKRVEAPTPSGSNGGSGPGVVVSWSAVQGASAYEIQWSDDAGFEKSPNTGTTLQTAFRIPDTQLGRQYWRVRAVVNDVKGQWSGAVRYVDIVQPTVIRYGLNRSKTIARGTVQITGELKVAGAAANSERLRLQRKTGGCDNDSGRYVDSSLGITGQEADDGMVNIPARVFQNTCFRYAWTSGDEVRYSAPIPVKVVPWIKVYKNRKVIRRGRGYCVTMRSNVAINGRFRMQYRVGKTWRTARSTMVRNKKAARVCPRISKAGRYPTRAYFDYMKKRGQGWTQFENVMRGNGMIRVNDVWRIVRSR